MTVKELIEALQKLPEDARVYRQGDNYKGELTPIVDVNYQVTTTWGREANTVELK